MAAEWSDRRGIDWGPNATILNEDVRFRRLTAEVAWAGAEDGQTAVFTMLVLPLPIDTTSRRAMVAGVQVHDNNERLYAHRYYR